MTHTKISIITVTWNVEKTIASTIQSIEEQGYDHIEYIVVDGGSTDATLSVIDQYRSRIQVLISEPDQGIYDAINKGIRAATGDVIGLLNADDMLADANVIADIAAVFNAADPPDAVIGDICFVKQNDSSSIVRHYSAKNWRPSRFAWGFMPPHPSFYCKRSVYMRLGLYHLDYKIGADYELLVRYLLVHKIRYQYLPRITTRMRLGGVSTRGFKSLLLLNREIKKACAENNVYTNYALIYSKYFFKIFEFLRKR